MDNVTPGLTTGTATDAIAGEHLILTAAGMDAHIHMHQPPAGLGGPQQRGHHVLGRRYRPLRRHQRRHHHQWPVEPGDDAPVGGRPADQLWIPGRGTRAGSARSSSRLEAGAAGFKIHEDYGTTPSNIRASPPSRR